MTDSELFAAVRTVLERAQQRVVDEMSAAVLADLHSLLEEVEAAIERAEKVAALRAKKGREISESSRRHLLDLQRALVDLAAVVRTGALR